MTITPPERVAELLRPLREEPASAAVISDYDGTLAPIVGDPTRALPLPQAGTVLSGLAASYDLVAVVSGRPVAFLSQYLPEDITIIGLYGLERLEHGRHWEHPNSGAWRETIADVAALAAVRGPEGMRVEPKGLSLTLHYREHPEVEREALAYAREQGDRSGLEVRRAKKSIELHPPIDADKGTAIMESVRPADRSILYIGDDVGDVAAFEALTRLQKAGRHTVKVAVDSNELSADLRDRADLVVPGPEGALDLLRSLAPPVR
ncbi:MAG: hypothetical protein JJLCMIEE_01554 [Acidimicrobiales bacterium]|nr:MAG: trehalose-phosphatase [Actinomycetota bacterium]MBV6508490.1 hypothetical protein [Acidimicrobiales bacterium]RIK05192.1 MAG: trehalose-phosphatase [Acidobacteriota bacterium]